MAKKDSAQAAEEARLKAEEAALAAEEAKRLADEAAASANEQSGADGGDETGGDSEAAAQAAEEAKRLADEAAEAQASEQSGADGGDEPGASPSEPISEEAAAILADFAKHNPLEAKAIVASDGNCWRAGDSNSAWLHAKAVKGLRLDLYEKSKDGQFTWIKTL